MVLSGCVCVPQALSPPTFSLPCFQKTTSPKLSSFGRAYLCLRNCSTLQVETLTSKQAEQVSLYIDALIEWNQRMNLTSVTERTSIMERHIADSLALLPVSETTYSKHNKRDTYENLKVVDVGSGAGLPGIVLAIARPAWEVTLMESIQKRCSFLEHVIQVSGLRNVKVLRARAEDAGHEISYRETFDIAVARAVAEMRTLVELCLPLVRLGGLLVAAKGADVQEEVESAKKAAGLLGATILPIQKVASHGPYGQRTAILCLKEQKTPRQYPRKAGIPNKKPL